MNRPPPPPVPKGNWRIGRLAGVDLLIRPSLLLMAAVLVAMFGPRFGSMAGINNYVLATIFVVGLYVSVLIHELAHVVAARSYRMRVPSVTLHLLGGQTAIEGDSRTPGQEFWTSLVGPLTSLAIAVAAWWSTGWFSSGDTTQVLGAVAYVNVIVGVLNLLPGLPLDGGRVFRAVVWAISGSRSAGTKAAAWAGRVLAVIALAVPLWWAFRYGDSRLVVDLVVAILIAAFLWAGASQALRAAQQDQRLDRIRARELLANDIPDGEIPATIPALAADLRGADLLRAMAANPADHYRLVESDGSTLGVLHSRTVDDAYRKGAS